MSRFDSALAHANSHWYRPCADGVVWTAHYGIDVGAEARKLRLTPREWGGVFLRYPTPSEKAPYAEGLFLVPAGEANLPTLQAREFMSVNFQTKKFLCSWKDAYVQSSEGQTPPHHGLNDCTHFVAECLAKAGVPVSGLLGAPEMVARLQQLGRVKTLAEQVDMEAARRTINAGALTPGDVIAFSHPTKGFRHCTLYLGDRCVAMHTYFNHPDGPPDRFADEDDGGRNNWEVAANPSHPLMTLLHFADDDLDPQHNRWAFGWWKVLANGRTYYYHLAPDGRAVWTDTRPARPDRTPIQWKGKGYWFGTETNTLQVCWRTGGFDQFVRIPYGRDTYLLGSSDGNLAEGERIGV